MTQWYDAAQVDLFSITSQSVLFLLYQSNFPEITTTYFFINYNFNVTINVSLTLTYNSYKQG